MKKSIFHLFIKLWNMIDISNIKTKMIIYFILVIINLPLETIFLPYMVLSQFSNISKKNITPAKIFYVVSLFFMTYLVLKIIEHIRYRLGIQLEIQMYIDTKKTMMHNIMDTYKNSQKELPLGRIINHMENVPFLVEQIIYKSLCYLIPETVCIISIVIFLFYVDPILGIMGFIFLFIYMSYLFKNLKIPQQSAKQEAKHRAKQNQNVLNTLDNILYILINDSFDFEKQNFKRYNDKHYEKFSSCETNNGKLFFVLDSISIVFLGILCWRLYHLILTKKFTHIYTGVFIVLLFGFEKLVDFKYMITEISTSLYKSEVFLEDIKELETSENNNKTTRNKISYPLYIKANKTSNNLIEIKNLFYKYPKSKNHVLVNKSISFKKNKITAIKGESGCGKTTLGKIIMGLVNPDSGNIFINSANLTNNFKKRQKLVGYIPQNVKLFESSLLDNIRYTCIKNVDKNYVDKWVEINNVKHILMKDPNDRNYLDRNVGIAGSELSGGQKQIVIILRTFLANICDKNKKKIFILDEPTAALDPNTSQIIINLLKKFSKQYTILIITHDKTIAKKCHSTYLLS